MRENDFEKDARSLLDGFKIKPSEAVWIGIEVGVKDKGKKRFPFWWVPIAAMLLGVGIYLLSGHSSDNDGEQQTLAQGTAPTPAVNSKTNAGVQNKENLKNNNTAYGDNVTQSLTTPGLPSEFEKADDVIDAVSNKASKNIPINGVGTHKDGKLINAKSTAKGHDGKAATQDQALAIVGRKSENEEGVVTNATNYTLVNQPDELLMTIQVANNSGTALSNQIAIPERKLDILSKGHNPWSEIHEITRLVVTPPIFKWGVQAGAGVSSTTKGMQMFTKDESPTLQYNPNIPPGNDLESQSADRLQMATVLANFVNLPSSQSNIKQNTAWHIGSFLKWYPVPRLGLTGALNYSYMSTSRQVGAPVSNIYFTPANSSVQVESKYAANNTIINPNAYNSLNTSGRTSHSGLESTYTNAYHFIDLPVGVEWQVNPVYASLPLWLNTGITMRYLISTSALHYSEKGFYYEDKSGFNNFQMGAYAGVSAEFFKRKKHSLNIGPYVHYGFTNVLKPQYKISQYPLTLGLQAQVTLGKK